MDGIKKLHSEMARIYGKAYADQVLGTQDTAEKYEATLAKLKQQLEERK